MRRLGGVSGWIRGCGVTAAALVCAAVMVVSVPGCESGPSAERLEFRDDVVATAGEAVALLEAVKDAGATPEGAAAAAAELEAKADQLDQAAGDDPSLAQWAALLRLVADQLTEDPAQTDQAIDQGIAALKGVQEWAPKLIDDSGGVSADGVAAGAAQVGALLPPPFNVIVPLGGLGLAGYFKWRQAQEKREREATQLALKRKVDGISAFLANGANPEAKTELRDHLRAAENADPAKHIAKAKTG